MKTNYHFLGLILLFILSNACSEKASYKDELGGFAVNFVEEPVKSSKDFTTELGPVQLHSYLEEVSLTKARMVTYSDYPINQQYIKNPYAFIDGAKVGALNRLGITQIIKEEKVVLNDVPGIEVIGTNDQNLYMHYKLFLKVNRLYQVGFLKEGLEEITKEDTDFMNSFQIL